MVPLKAVGKVAVGRPIPILVAQDNPAALMFDWDNFQG
jgi:hypothetical protein